MARPEDLWKLALKARRQYHARFEKAEREGRLEEEFRLYDAELRKKWGGVFKFAPMPPPYPGSLRLVPPVRKPRKGVSASARRRKRNPE